MASKEFKLPPISPLIGSSPEVYRKTLAGHSIEPQFKTKKFLTELIMGILSPFRWYENAVHVPRIRKVEPKEMVFIVGHWRGGTTYLHNLMCQAADASFVTTYQTVFPIFMGSKGLLQAVHPLPDARQAPV